VEIGLKPIVKEQLQLIFASRPMEEEELQQPIVEEQPQLVLASRPVSSGQEFLQELFEKRLVSSIIP
jgi:hypothetical protein